MKPTQTPLTLEQTDELILAACTPSDGAIEDCEVSEETVACSFETGAVDTVSRVTGETTFESSIT